MRFYREGLGTVCQSGVAHQQFLSLGRNFLSILFRLLRNHFLTDSQRLIIFSQDSLLTYNLLKRQPQKYSYSNKLPVKLQLATHFMNTTDGKLYVYELNNLPLGDAAVAALDLNNQEWGNRPGSSHCRYSCTIMTALG